LLGAQAVTYWTGFRQEQAVRQPEVLPFTDILRDTTPSDSVIVVAGADWNAAIPLYAQRRALMIRNGLEHDHDYLKRAFQDLAGEDVSAIVLCGPVRQNTHVLRIVTDSMDFDMTTPTFFHREVDIYIS